MVWEGCGSGLCGTGRGVVVSCSGMGSEVVVCYSGLGRGEVVGCSGTGRCMVVGCSGMRKDGEELQWFGKGCCDELQWNGEVWRWVAVVM